MRPRYRELGGLLLLSDVPGDRFFPALLKKTYGKVALESGESGVICSLP